MAMPPAGFKAPLQTRSSRLREKHRGKHTVRRIAASTRFQRGERRARHLRLLRLAALAGAKRPPLGGRRFPCGSERTRARAAPPSRWSRASLAALCSRAPRRAACGCGRNDTRTGLRRKDSDSTTSSRSTPTWRLDYASSVATSAGGGLLPRRPARTPATPGTPAHVRADSAHREQFRVVDLGLVHTHMRVRLRGHGKVALAHVRADLRPRRALAVEQADPTVAQASAR
jgi:hypothetical protein